MSSEQSHDGGSGQGSHASDFAPVAYAYLRERGAHRPQALRRYIERHPGFASDLMLLSVETALTEFEGADPVQAAALQAERLSAALHARLQALARAALAPSPAAQSAAPVAVSSLVAQARAHAGLTPRALAGHLGIGTDVLALLEEHHIRPETVGARFIRRAAATLGTPVAAIQAFLAVPQAGPRMAVAYHAPAGHDAVQRLSFAEAIAASPLMDDAAKAAWRAEDSAADFDAASEVSAEHAAADLGVPDGPVPHDPLG